MELAPPDEPRARCLAAIALGAAYVLNGRAEAADWLAEAAALIEATPALRDDVRLAALLGVPPTFLRTDQAGYAPLRRAVALARERGAAGRAAVRALLRRHGCVRERPLGRGRRPLRGGGAPRRRDRAARRRRHLPRRARAGVCAPRRRRGRRARRRRARPGGASSRCRGSRPRRCTPRATSSGAAARCRRRSSAFEAKLRVMEDDGIRDTDLSPLPELVELLVQLERRDEAAALGRALRRGGGRQGRRVGARARPPGRRAGRRRGGRAPLRRGARAARRRPGRLRARPHPSSASASACAASGAVPTPASRCAPPSPRSTRSAPRRGPSARAPS